MEEKKNVVKEAVITGLYNELGYVVRKNGRAIYAAGNNPYESQDYLNAEDGVGVEKIAEFCADTIEGILSDPSLWEDVVKAQSIAMKNGGTKYSKSLKPREVAVQTGDLPYSRTEKKKLEQGRLLYR